MLLRSGIIICFVLLHIHSYARYPFIRYTKENGLPSNTVYEVYRDSKGYIWIGTDKGAVRFDGTTFQVFNTSDGLPDNDVFFLQEDYQERIWLATYTGALCYYKNGVFHNAQNTPFLKTLLTPDLPVHITLQKDSSVIVCYKNLKIFINIRNDSCRIYKRKPYSKTSYSYPFNIRKISDSIFRILYEDELHYLNVNNGVTSYCIPPEKVRSIQYHNQEFLYDAKFIYDRNFKKIGTIPQPAREPVHVNRIYFDGANFLTATDDGLYIGRQQLFKDRRVVSVTEDIAGSYWVATLGDGIYRIPKDFGKSRFIPDAYTGVVTYACDYAGTQYFATDKRHLYEIKNGHVKMLLDFSEGIPNVRNQGTHIDCSINKNTLYCIGRKGTIYTYDILKKKIRQYTIPKIHRNAAAQGKSIIATDSGLNIILAAEICFIPCASFKSNLHIPNVIATDFHNRVYAATSDNKGNIIHSRPAGINITTGSRSSLQPQYGKRLFIWLQYHHNTLLGCTPSNELLFFSLEGSKLKTDSFFAKNIIWNHAYPLSPDQLLLRSDKHYYILALPDSGKKYARPIPVANPFLPPDAEYVLSGGNNCYFFKNGGITVIDKKDLSSLGPAPVIYFDKVTVGDSIFRMGNNDSALTLSRRHAATAHISFDILAFNATDAVYEYSITTDGGTPSAWEQIANKELNLTLPRYGTVNLFVRTENHAGIKSKPKQFTIAILKPWWARWWGIAIIGLCAIAILWLLFYFYLRRTLKHKEEEHRTKIRLLNAEFKTLNAMMNPHFIFNTLNNVQAFINAGDKHQANEYIRIFSDMVRQNMLNISKEMVTLTDEMALVERYLQLQRLRFNHIAYDIFTDPTVDTDDIMVPPLLIQPLVENSIKHGLLPSGKAEGFINITISGTGDIITIAITDNGIGISRSETRHTSFALEALKKRIETVSATQNVTITFEISDYISPPRTSGTRALLTISYRS